MAGTLQELTLITAVWGRKKEFIQNVIAYSWAVEFVHSPPCRLIVFSDHPDFGYDELVDILKKYSDLATKYEIVTCDPKGIYNALNIGIRSVNTKRFMFYHSDDTLTPNALKYIDEALDDDGTVVSYGIAFNSRIVVPCLDSSFPYSKIGINHMATIFPTEIHRRYEYNESFRYSADWDTIIRMHIDGIPFRGRNQCIVVFAEGGASTKVSIRRLCEDSKILLSSIVCGKTVLSAGKRLVLEWIGFFYALVRQFFNFSG